MKRSRFAMLSRGRTSTRGEMNRTEQQYANELQLDPGVLRWWYEPMSLRLSSPPEGQPARYTPDFLILMTDGTTFVDDVKGSGLDDPASLVRIKCAAEAYPLWVFRVVKRRTKRDGGGWSVREV